MYKNINNLVHTSVLEIQSNIFDTPHWTCCSFHHIGDYTV